MKKSLIENFISEQSEIMQIIMSSNPKEQSISRYEFEFLNVCNGAICDRERLPQHIIDLLPKEKAKIFINWDEIGSNRIEMILNKITPDMEEELKGCFFKLASRSAKDSGEIRFSGKKQIEYVINDSLRWAEDLNRAKTYRIGTYIYFLEWLDYLSYDKELRVFVYGGEIKGISAYNYQSKVYNFSEGFVERVVAEVNEKVLAPIASGNVWWNLNEFVIDVCERPDGSVQFIEINSYFESDPCCYGDHKSIGEPFFVK